MEHVKTIPELIDLWLDTPTGRARGANVALAEDLDTSPGHIRTIRARRRIDQKLWAGIVAAASKRAAMAGPRSRFALVTADFMLALDASERAWRLQTPPKGRKDQRTGAGA